MTENTDVTLREYIERIVEEKEAALRLAAKEYERRLDCLNGEAERLRVMQATYVSRDLYDQRHNQLDVRLAALEKMVWMGLGAVLVFGTVMQVILHFLR